MRQHSCVLGEQYENKTAHSGYPGISDVVVKKNDIKSSLSLPDPLLPTVFHNSWWLEAASGGDYKVAEFRMDNRVVGRLPYIVRRKRTGHVLCTMPELCDELGPAIDGGSGKAVNRTARIRSIADELAGQLDEYANIRHRLHSATEDAFAFMDRGCNVTADFTSRIYPAPEDSIWKAMRDKTRNVIRKAEKEMNSPSWISPDEFARFYSANLHARGHSNVHCRIKEITAAAMEKGCGTPRGIRKNGELTAAVFVPFDSRKSWLLLTSRTPDSCNGAVSLLIWDAIREASAASRTFDFDGITTAGSRLFYGGFGGVTAPRLLVSRHSMGYRIARKLSAGEG